MSTVLFPWRQAGALAFINSPCVFSSFRSFSSAAQWLDLSRVEPCGISRWRLRFYRWSACFRFPFWINVHEESSSSRSKATTLPQLYADEGVIYNGTIMGVAREYFPEGVDKSSSASARWVTVLAGSGPG
jgi:hypothetical protein